jgi:hypothetical protein
MWPYRSVSDWALTGGGEGGRRHKDTGYLKGNLDSQFQQEIRQCLRYDPKWDPENDKDEM